MSGLRCGWLGICGLPLFACSEPVSAPVSGSSTTKETGSEGATDSSEPATSDSGEWVDTQEPVDTGDTGETEPINLLLNPGFEEGAEPWSIWGGAERVEGQARSGAWALKATSTNGAEQRVEGLEPNTSYRLSGWAKTEGSEPMAIGVKGHGNDELNVRILDPEYAEASLEFTTGLGSTSAVIYAYKHSGDQPGYADDLFLEELGASDLILVWSDEFDGSGQLDEDKWTHEEGFVRNEELQWYQAENASREEGFLVIEARPEDRPNPNYVEGSTSWKTSRERIEYTSASVNTAGRFEWQYGRVAVRAKVSNFMGTWPAIWTLGTDCEWPSNGEVDIMENYGGNILANFAWGTDTRWSPEWDSSHWPVADFGKDWVVDFHIWELVWTEESMTILLDGEVLNSVSLSLTSNGSAACEGQNPFQQPHYLLLNLALGSAGGSVEALTLPTRYVVDYVRIYQ